MGSNDEDVVVIAKRFHNRGVRLVRGGWVVYILAWVMFMVHSWSSSSLLPLPLLPSILFAVALFLFFIPGFFFQHKAIRILERDIKRMDEEIARIEALNEAMRTVENEYRRIKENQ